MTGALLPSGKVDLEATGRLIAAARPLTVTFHRAIDDSAEVFDSLEDIISLGADRVLSSGGCATALEGAAVLKEMVKRAAGRIIVMPGCGITPDNLSQVAAITGALEFHGTRI